MGDAPPARSGSIRVGVVGLGTGTLAAWGKLGDYIRYYEINPAIIRIATDPQGYFTYVRDSSAKVEIALGRGKDLYDKRQSIRERETKRDMERAVREARR